MLASLPLINLLSCNEYEKIYSQKNTLLAVMADKPKEQVEAVAPDPDEDDLDDLDGTYSQTNI